MRRILHLCVALVLMLTCITSCFKEDDFSNLDDLQFEVTPEWGIPLLTGSLGMEDLVSTSGTTDLPINIIMNDSKGYYVVSYADTLPIMSNGVIVKRFPKTKADIITIGPNTSTVDIGFFQNQDLGNVSLKDINLRLDALSNEAIDMNFYNISAELISKNGNKTTIELKDVNLSHEGTKTLIDTNIASSISFSDPVVSATITYTIDLDISTVPDMQNLSIDIAAEVGLGLYGYASNLEYLDTLDFSMDMNSDSDTLSKYIQSAGISYRFDNGFPFDLNVQLYFLDENYIVKDSLFNTPLLVASAPVSNESATGTTLSSGNAAKSGEQVQNLTESKYAVIRANFSTLGAPTKSVVKISDLNRLGVKLRVKAKAIVNDDLLND